MSPERNVTQLLQAVNAGADEAYGDLLQAVYGELRSLAGALMRREQGYRTLQPTALVHEAYLRLVLPEARWQSRAHFFGAAAQSMRRILVEHARLRLSRKRGGGLKRVTFKDVDVQVEDPQLDLIALDEALTALGKLDGRLVRVVELRYFAGCSLEETAELLGLAPATVKRDWAYARAWLLERLQGSTGSAGPTVGELSFPEGQLSAGAGASPHGRNLPGRVTVRDSHRPKGRYRPS